MRLQRCLIPTKDIREIAKHFGWNPVIAVNRVGMWQTQTNSSDIPSISQMEEFADALKDDADFQKPLKDLINATGKMVYSFNETTKRPGVVSSSTLEAIQKGERTATTRYEHLDYWGKVKAGDIVQFNDEKGNGVYVRITSPLAKLSPDTSAEEWSKKEGWSVEYFEKNVRPRIDEAFQMEYEYLGDVDKFTHVPYYTGNITPSENTIFVFGSNPEGRHGAGAAKVAVEKFGAQYGVGEGLTGNTYALPTKDLRVKENDGLRSIPKNVIVNNIKNLYASAKQNPGKVFKIAFRNGLTEVTLNGYNGQEMIEMFIEAGPIPANIMFSKEWVDTGLFSKASFISVTSGQNGFKTLNTDSMGEYTEETQKEFIPEEINDAPKKVHSSRPQSLFDNVRKLNSAFTPQQLEKRIKNVAYEFSNYIDILYANKIKELKNKAESLPEKSLERFQVIGELNALQSTLNGRDVFISNYLNIQDVIAGVKQSVREKQQQNLNKERTEENKEVLDYRLDQFNKMLDNIDLLLMEAMTEIEANEGIRIVLSQAVDAKGKVVLIGFAEKNTSNEDETDDDDDRVVSGNSGWAFSFNKQDTRQSITQGVRNVLRHIPAIEQDSFDDLGYTQYLDSDYVYATILNGCSWMIDSDDFYIKKLNEYGEEDIYLPAIDKLVAKYPWMSAVQNHLYAQPELLAQFYTCFRRDFKPYYMLSSGKLASLNKEMSLANAISSITRNYEQGIMLHEDSIFDKNGNLNKNQKENIELVKSLQEDLQHDSWSPEDYNTLRELLNIIGIETDVALDKFLDLYKTDSQGALDKTNNEITYKSVSKILANIKTILENLNEVPQQAHLISHFNQEYAAIAKIVGSVTRFNRGMTFRQDGDAYSSYQFPNYATTLFKKILSEDPLRRTSIFNFYKQSDYFHFNGKFRNYMLRELESNDALVEELREGCLLSINMLRQEKQGTMSEFLQETEAVPYDKWTAAQVKQVFIKSYFSAGNSSKSNMQYAYYRFPIFADVTEAMLFKFKRFTGNYKEQILPLLRDVVMQEFSRQGLVERRENNPNKIGNFDKNGDKFFFFPEMNDYLVEADYSTMKSYYMGFKNTDKWEKAQEILKSLNILDKNGNEINGQKTPEKIRVQFKDAIYAYKAQGKNNTVISIIDSTIKSILDKQFRVFMSKNILNNIPLIESLVEDNIIPKSELENALKALEDKRRGNLKELKVEEKKEKEEKEENTSQYATLEEALEEYYWNDSLMQSQIIQLTVIDPAYFKFDGGVDFQKRYKQIYAAGRKLFIHSKYGRKYEKTIYLSDRITISRRYNDIKKLFDKAVENKYITKEQRDTILAKFSDINNTDAQAFRELSSMRAVLDMLGEWDDATMGQSYERIINGGFDPQDFDTIWQILKPFMYTIVAKDDGVGGKMLVPHQNKNSEFLILAAYQMFAAATSGHTKLKALSKFMQSHEIDVAMFDSAVKAGVQNPIDLNISISKLEKIKDDIWEQINNAAKKALKSKYKEGRTKNNFYSGTEYLLHNDYITQEQYDSLMDFVEPSEEEMLQILEKECFDENGQENLNTIHIMEYNDYMLASPNPEHWIDSKVVDGSQKRNLLPADMPDDADFRVVVDGIEMTKQQVLDHYDGIIIENLIDDFFGVKNSVSNKVALQKSLIQQVKGNPKYSRDFTNCLQLTERNGKMVFAVPLDFPSVRAKVAELILAKFIFKEE